MPSYLDLALIAVVLISALLSMLRGFTREVLAIVSWAMAAAAAYYFHPVGVPYIHPQYLAKIEYARIASATAIFFATLIVVSIITVKISDMILDSKIGALDRSLGFLFGAGRGYLLAVIAFLFFAWLVPEKNYPTWVQNSKTRSWLEATGSSLQAMLPDNLGASISERFKKQKGDEAPPDADPEKSAPAAPTPPLRPGQRSEAPAPGAAAPVAAQAPRAAPVPARPTEPQSIEALIQQGTQTQRR